MKIDWKLKGSNLLRFGCGKDVTVHPETCSDVVLMGHNGSQSLTDWITGGDPQVNIESSLGAWLDANLSDIQVPYAGNDTLDGLDNIVHHPGKIYPGEGLSIALNGSEDIPGELKINAATTSTYGGIKLFDTSETLPEGGVPVQLSNGKAYVDLSGGVQSDYVIYRWDEYNPTHTTTTPAINPSAYIVNENADNFSNINIYNYINTIKNLFNTSVDELRIYPVRTDAAGHLYTFVPWTDTPYYVYNNTSTVGAGLVPYSSDSSINSTAFLGKDGYWKVPSYTNLQNKPTVYVGVNSGFVPQAPTTGLATKYLRADGAWVTPPNDNTTYSADEESILMATGNVFYDPHQFSRVTSKHGKVSDFIKVTKYRKIDYTVVGVPATSTELITDIQNIFETIAKLSENCAFTFTYSYDYDDVLSWDLDGGTDSSFIAAYVAGVLKCNICGDITATPSATPITATDKITCEIGTSSTMTHTDLVFAGTVEESLITLTITSYNKTVQLSL